MMMNQHRRLDEESPAATMLPMTSVEDGTNRSTTWSPGDQLGGQDARMMRTGGQEQPGHQVNAANVGRINYRINRSNWRCTRSTTRTTGSTKATSYRPHQATMLPDATNHVDGSPGQPRELRMSGASTRTQEKYYVMINAYNFRSRHPPTTHPYLTRSDEDLSLRRRCSSDLPVGSHPDWPPLHHATSQRTRPGSPTTRQRRDLIHQRHRLRCYQPTQPLGATQRSNPPTTSPDATLGHQVTNVIYQNASCSSAMCYQTDQQPGATNPVINDV